MNPTNDILHTKVCNERQAAAKAYEEKWPKFCRSCGGVGCTHSNGSREEPPSSDPCGACVDKEICPRCGAPGLLLGEQGDCCDYSHCLACNWNEWEIAVGNAPLDAYPDVDCYCWEPGEAEQAKREQEEEQCPK